MVGLIVLTISWINPAPAAEEPNFTPRQLVNLTLTYACGHTLHTRAHVCTQHTRMRVHILDTRVTSVMADCFIHNGCAH